MAIGTNPNIGLYGTAPGQRALPAQPSGWQQAGQFAGSPTGSALIGAAGAFMAGKGQEKQAEADRRLREQQMAQDARLQAARAMYERAQAGADRPLGESQSFSQQQMLKAALASSLFKGQGIRPNNAAVASQMGYQAPSIPPEFLAQLSDPALVKQATSASIQQREADLLNINPHLAQTNLGAMGLSPAAAALQAQPAGTGIGQPLDPRIAARERGLQLWLNQDQLLGENIQAQDQRDLVAQYGPIDPKTGLPKDYKVGKDGQLEKKGFWDKGFGKGLKTAGKVAAIAAPIVAAPFTGGASLALIAAGAGAAGGALSGGGWKGAALGAGLGAATGGFGGGAAAGAGKSAITKAALGAAAKNALKDPRFIGGAYGAIRS